MDRNNYAHFSEAFYNGKINFFQSRKLPLLSVFLYTISFLANAQFLRSGDIRVYASAIASAQLNVQMARQYGITRSASNVLLNVVVRQGEPGKDITLPAKISAIAIRKNGARISINMQLTQEGRDVYYLGELKIAKNETILFGNL